MYDFRNQTAINILDNNEDSINSTILHESIHLLLTLQTRWGLFCYAARRISIYDKKFDHILDYLCLFSREVQEGTAVFCECINLIKKFDYEHALQYINELKKTNRTYYNYLKPLLIFIELLNPINADKYTFKSDELITFIFSLAKISLNSDLSKISTETIKSQEKFEEIYLNSQTSKEFIPNIRFNFLLNNCYDIIKSENPSNFTDILIRLSEVLPNEKNKINEIFCTNVKMLKENHANYLRDIKHYFNRLYKDSKNIEQIKIYLNSIQVREINFEQLPQYAIPTTFTSFKQVISDFNKMKKLTATRKGIIFYLGKMLDLIKTESDLFFVSKDDINNIHHSIMAKHAILYFDYENKKTHSMLAYKGQVEELMKESNSPIIVNYKFYDSNNDTIKSLDIDDKDIFIYCDRSYPNTVKLLNSITNKKAKCRIIDYGIMQLLTAKLSNKTYFILPFLPISYSQLISDIKNNIINLKLADNPDGKTLTDPYILPSEKNLHIYDLIINCLFYT